MTAASAPICHRCRQRPATTRVHVRSNLLAVGPTHNWDAANADAQCLRENISKPSCDGCASFLAVCWQTRRWLRRGVFQDIHAIWLLPLADGEPETIKIRCKRVLAEALAADPDGWDAARVQALFRVRGHDEDIHTCGELLRALALVTSVTAPAAVADTLFDLAAVTW